MYLLDSDVIIYTALPTRLALKAWTGRQPVAASLISVLEVMGYARISPEDKRHYRYFFAHVAHVFPIHRNIIQTAVDFRQTRRMSVGDAIIAATAARYRLPLVTNNHRDYAGLPGLEVLPLESIFEA